MELLCHRSGDTKAFKGKGERARLARQLAARLDELVGEMRQLSETSRRAGDGVFHYLALHRRPARCGDRHFLRWRDALHRHVRWAQVEQDLGRLPVGLHEAYHDMNRAAGELNALHSLYRTQRSMLAKLGRAHRGAGVPAQRQGSAKTHRNSPDRRCLRRTQ